LLACVRRLALQLRADTALLKPEPQQAVDHQNPAVSVDLRCG
jgi:hypothetical protein